MKKTQTKIKPTAHSIQIDAALWSRLKEISVRNKRAVKAQCELYLENAISIEEKARRYEGQDA